MLLDWTAEGWRVFEDDAQLDGHGIPLGVVRGNMSLSGPVHLLLYHGEGGTAHGWLQVPDLDARTLLESNGAASCQ